MPARLKPTLNIVGSDLVFQIAVGYETSIPIDETGLLAASNLLPALFALRDAATGIHSSQRVEGAYGVLDATKTKEVWSDWNVTIIPGAWDDSEPWNDSDPWSDT